MHDIGRRSVRGWVGGGRFVILHKKFLANFFRRFAQK